MDTAVDLGETGKDNLYGSGRASARFSSLDTSPRISSIFIDGVEQVSSLLPKTILVDGSTRNISVSDRFIENIDTRFGFINWNDGSTESSRIIVFNGNWTILNASFTLQYRLGIKSAYGSSEGENWYDSGSTASISIESQVDHGNGTRRLFSSWIGVSSSDNNTATVIMDSPKTVNVNWRKQYELKILDTLEQSDGGGWYDSGLLASFSTAAEFDQGNGTRNIFISWSGDFSSTDTSGSLLIDSPKEITVNWRKQYMLELEAPTLSSFSGGGWHDAGALITVFGDNVWENSGQSRFNLRSVLIDGDQINVERRSTGITSISLEMDSPHSIVINASKQFLFNVDGGRNVVYEVPSPTLDNWWDEGQTISVESDHVWRSTGHNDRQSLLSYVLDGELFIIPRSNISTFKILGIIMDMAHSLEFESVTQYMLIINGGQAIETSPSPTHDLWFDSGSTVNVSTLHILDSADSGIREQLVSWQLNQDEADSVLRSEDGSFQIDDIDMSHSNTVTFKYVTQYLIDVSSKYNVPTGGGWYDNGATVHIEVSPISEYGNNTRHILYLWIGNIFSENKSVSMNVSFPMKLDTIWKTQYFVEVNSIFGTTKGEGWYDKGSVAFLDVSPKEVLEDGTRHMFMKWESDESPKNIGNSMIVEAPSKVSSKWATQYLTSLTFRDKNGNNEIKPKSIEIINSEGQRTILDEFQIWLNEDIYVIDRILWMNVDVKGSEETRLFASNPSEMIIPTEINSLTINVRDIFSFPIPDADVTTLFANGTLVTSQTDSDGRIKYNSIPLGKYSTNIDVMGLSSNVSGDSILTSEITITMLMIPQILLLTIFIVGLSISTIIITRKKSSIFKKK
jgi:hypothetical protein